MKGLLKILTNIKKIKVEDYNQVLSEYCNVLDEAQSDSAFKEYQVSLGTVDSLLHDKFAYTRNDT